MGKLAFTRLDKENNKKKERRKRIRKLYEQPTPVRSVEKSAAVQNVSRRNRTNQLVTFGHTEVKIGKLMSTHLENLKTKTPKHLQTTPP